MTIGEKITGLRQLRGLTQEEFCADFNRQFPDMQINRKRYSHWERDYRNMEISHLKALVIYYRRYHVTADELLFDEQVPALLKKSKPLKKRLHNVAL